MKKFLISFLMLNSLAFGITLEEIEIPKGFLGRLSTTDKPEAFKVVEKVKKTQATDNKTVVKRENKNNIKIKGKIAKQNQPQVQMQIQKNEAEGTFADLSLKKLALDVAIELEEEQNKINSDLNILWNAAMERSETMKYTIYKLSNPDEDKPNDSTIKKILRPIANISTLAGASVAGDPYMATGALIGGGLVNAFMKDDKEYNYKFSKVSDADMVLLIRKVDELQKKLLDLYVDYKSKESLVKLTDENLKKREENFKLSEDKTNEELVVADAYYRSAKTNARKAHDEFLTSRSILENLVGNDALLKIEE